MAFGIHKDFLIVRMDKEQGEQSLMNAWEKVISGKEANKMKKIPKFKSEEEAARFWETHSAKESKRVA